MYNQLRQLIKIPSVSGREQRLGAYIKEQMKPYFDEITTDNLGNLICHKKGAGKKLMFAAHMDEIGFMVTYIEDNGNLRFACLGGINLVACAGAAVVFENGRKGILVPEEGVKPEDYRFDKFVVDIGAKSGAEAARLVKIGDCFAVEGTLFRMAGSRIAGRPIDDKIGCAILMEAAKELDGTNDVYFVFTVQEEVGIRGAKTAAFAIAPDYGIAVDITGTGDAQGAKPMAVKMGGGAAIKIKDRSAICDVELVDLMKRTAEERKIPYQLEILPYGGTDAASMQVSGAGCKAGCISIPTRNAHTSVETVDLKDCEACKSLVAAMANMAF